MMMNHLVVALVCLLGRPSSGASRGVAVSHKLWPRCVTEADRKIIYECQKRQYGERRYGMIGIESLWKVKRDAFPNPVFGLGKHISHITRGNDNKIDRNSLIEWWLNVNHFAKSHHFVVNSHRRCENTTFFLQVFGRENYKKIRWIREDKLMQAITALEDFHVRGRGQWPGTEIRRYWEHKGFLTIYGTRVYGMEVKRIQLSAKHGVFPSDHKRNSMPDVLTAMINDFSADATVRFYFPDFEVRNGKSRYTSEKLPHLYQEWTFMDPKGNSLSEKKRFLKFTGLKEQ